MARRPTSIQGIVHDSAAGSPSSTTAHPGIGAGFKLCADGQIANTSASAVANQCLGAVSLPAVNAGVVGDVTLSNTLITATSYILLTLVGGATEDDTVVLYAKLKKPGAGSVHILYTPNVNMTQAATAWYLILGAKGE
jgi:hypothetical protein